MMCQDWADISSCQPLLLFHMQIPTKDPEQTVSSNAPFQMIHMK